MQRLAKQLLIASLFALIVCASFAGGRHFRRVAVGPVRVNTRVTSLPESGIGATSDTAPDQNDNPADTFDDVYRYIHTDYVDKVDDEKKLSYGALRTMLMSLDDPKTRFLDPSQLKMSQDQLEGRFKGIGATVAVIKQKKPNGIDQRRLAVVAPAPGSPAEKAGVRAGDIITHIDGKWIIAYDPRLDLDRLHGQDMSDADYRKAWRDSTNRLREGITLQKALDLINEKDGKALDLTIERAGSAAPVKLSLITASTDVEPMEFRNLGEGVGYLRVTEFTDKADAALDAALKDSTIKSVIVDLRDNPGGPVPGKADMPAGALSILSRLSPDSRVGSVMRRGNQKDEITVQPNHGRKLKVAVLMNGGTSNTAELVASALKERAGAKLIGSHTFGDSVLQRLITLKAGGAMTLTAGKLLAVSGRDFTGKGLQPDISLDAGTPRSTDDPAIQRAILALAG